MIAREERYRENMKERRAIDLEIVSRPAEEIIVRSDNARTVSNCAVYRTIKYVSDILSAGNGKIVS